MVYKYELKQEKQTIIFCGPTCCWNGLFLLLRLNLLYVFSVLWRLSFLFPIVFPFSCPSFFPPPFLSWCLWILLVNSWIPSSSLPVSTFILFYLIDSHPADSHVGTLHGCLLFIQHKCFSCIPIKWGISQCCRWA